jgi:hypothetical protein
MWLSENGLCAGEMKECGSQSFKWVPYEHSLTRPRSSHAEDSIPSAVDGNANALNKQSHITDMEWHSWLPNGYGTKNLLR